MQIERRNQAPEVDAAAARMSACHTHAEVTAFTYDDVNSRSRPFRNEIAPSPRFVANLTPVVSSLGAHFHPATVWHHPGDGSSKFRDAPLTYNIYVRVNGHFHSFRIALVYFNYRSPEKMYEFAYATPVYIRKDVFALICLSE